MVSDEITELQQEGLLRAVSSAAGINEERGDTISVEPMPFDTSLSDQQAEAARLEQLRKDRIFYTEIAAMILLAALLLGGFLMYRWRKRKERQAALEAKLEAERLAKEEAKRVAEEKRRAEEMERKRIEAEELEQRVAEAEARAAELAALGITAEGAAAAAEGAEGGAEGVEGLTKGGGGSAPEDEEEEVEEEDDGLTPEERQLNMEKEAILKLIDEKPEEVAWLIKMWLIEDE